MTAYTTGVDLVQKYKSGFNLASWPWNGPLTLKWFIVSCVKSLQHRRQVFCIDFIWRPSSEEVSVFFLFILFILPLKSMPSFYNHMFKSYEIWHTGRGSCQEAMTLIWHWLAKGGCYNKQLKMQIMSRYMSCPVWLRVMKLCSHIPSTTGNKFVSRNHNSWAIDFLPFLILW